jgi:hypothetical protein
MDLARPNRGLAAALTLILLGVVASGSLMGASECAAAETVVLEATQDNTIYSESADTSNGAGIYLFCGVTNIGEKRRALLLFDVAGNVPEGATITSASLVLVVNRQPTSFAPSSISVYRCMSSWGEAGSDATANEGQGAPAQPGDATWTYRDYDTVVWTTPGGDILLPLSAAVAVPGLGTYALEGANMVADVQDMLDNPADNFGWIVLGEEAQSRTALRLPSREFTTQKSRPQLSIEYEPKVPADESSMGRLKSAYDQ